MTAASGVIQPVDGIGGRARASCPAARYCKGGFPNVVKRWENGAQFVNLRIRTLSTNPKAASVAITDEPP